MAVTYEPIASTTLGSSAASVTLSSIAATWTDLVVVVTGANSEGSALSVRFNSDTGSNYSHTYLQGDGTSATSDRRTNQTGAWCGSFTTGGPHFSALHVMSYANTNVYKTFVNASNRTGAHVRRTVGLWRSTSAIDAVTILVEFGSLDAGTTVSLYGIKAA